MIEIGDNTRVNGSCIHAWDSVKIGQNCLIAANCNIMDSNGHEALMDNPSERIKSQDKPKPIVIEDNVWMECNSIILKGITIGEGSIVSAGSVVMDNVPPHSIVIGNPAVVIDNDWAQIGAAAIQIIIGNHKYFNKLHQLILMDIYSLILAGVFIRFRHNIKMNNLVDTPIYAII